MIFDPQFVQVIRRYSRPLSSPHLHCQSPSEYFTKSSEQVSKDEAEEIKKKFEEAGAQVDLK